MSLTDLIIKVKSRLRPLKTAWKNMRPQTIDINGKPIVFSDLVGDTANQIRNKEEFEVYEYIARLPKGSVFYDFGASLGNFCLYAAACGLETYAFEPEEKNFGALTRNKRANGFGNLHLFKVAVSDGSSAVGTLMMNGKGGAGDHSKVLKVPEISAFPGILPRLNAEQSVKTLSLDQIVSELKVPAPDYMKVDIDGSEVAFMKGATATLRNPKLKGLMFELFKDNEYFGKIVAELARNGFRVVKEYQIYSYAQKEEGLFNIEFAR